VLNKLQFMNMLAWVKNFLNIFLQAVF